MTSRGRRPAAPTAPPPRAVLGRGACILSVRSTPVGRPRRFRPLTVTPYSQTWLTTVDAMLSRVIASSVSIKVRV